jgi:hypothetical protein
LITQSHSLLVNKSTLSTHTLISPSTLSLEFHHIPVLAQPLIAGLGELVDRGNYLDCTVGGGGHSKLILEQAKAEGKNIHLVAIDRDQMAIAAARQNLADYAEQIQFWHGNYCDYDPGQLSLHLMASLLTWGLVPPKLICRSADLAFKPRAIWTCVWIAARSLPLLI